MSGFPVPSGTFVAQAPAPTGVAATDVAAIQALLNAGGSVRLQATGATHYNFGTGAIGVTVPAGAELVGTGMNGTQIDYGGTGWAVIVGNSGALGAALAYGCKVEGFRVNISAAGGNGIKCVETSNAVRRNVEVINNAAGVSTGTGFMRDGGNSADILGVDDNCYGLHMKFPHRWGTSGTQPTTSVTATACTGLADTIAGSAGLTVDTSSGQGSRWFGGDIESCVSGVNNNGLGVSFFGARFEGNTTDAVLGATSKATTFVGCGDLATITDNSGGSYSVLGSWSAVTSGTARVDRFNPPGPWIAIAGGIGYQNSWADKGGTYPVGQYRLTADQKHLELFGAVGGGANGTVAFTLPAAFRPAKYVAATIMDATVRLGTMVEVYTTGNVAIYFPAGGAATDVFFMHVVVPLDGN